MQDRDAFEAALDETPDDWNLRLIYADWLDEHGDQSLARAQRWMAEHERMPLIGPDALLRMLGVRQPANTLGRCWEWWVYGEGVSGVGRDLFRRIPTPYSTVRGQGYCSTESRDWLSYLEFETRRDAEAALAAGLDRQATGEPPQFPDPDPHNSPSARLEL